ncbi:MAG TPA: peptidoglycan DD-metalloendopeptidase family protein [Actinomycetota bacterium]|nr:peptidoglycan DD-metalloendopeptidase family protein [Actinomycetota bacterium]
MDSLSRRRQGFPRLRQGLALAVGLMLLAQVSPGSAQTTEQKLETAKRRAAQIQRELEGERAKLDALNAEIAGLNKQIAQAYAQRLAIKEQVEITEETIRRKGRRVDKLQGRLDERAREVYIQGPAGMLELVLEADSITDLSDRVSFLSALSEGDASTAIGIEVEREELGRFEEDLGGLLVEQDELLAQLREQDLELNERWEEQAAIEASIASKLGEAEELVADLKKKRRQELLAALRAASGSSRPIDASGILKWCPVDSPRSYIDDFGYPRSGGRTHQGNDIFAPEGTPIRAPFSGVADESWNTLGGNSVFVRASDGTYVYNAHLSRFAGVDGKQVNPGDLIGYVGNTGNAIGTPPHDHFELHPGGGSAITPYPYLNAVCGVNGGG